MHDPIQHLPFLRVVEDDLPEGFAVEGAIFQQNLRPEGFDDLLQSRRAGFDDLAGEDVGVDDGDVGIFEEFGDGGFAGSDAAGEADD